MKIDPAIVPILAALAGGAGGAGGVWAWLKEKESAKAAQAAADKAAPAQMTGAAAQFQEFLNRSFEAYVGDLKDDIDQLKGEVEDLKNAKRALETQNQKCENDANQLRQHVESLEQGLRRNGLDVPQRKLDRSFTVIDEHGTTTMRADSAEDGPPSRPYRPRKRKPIA